MLITDPSVPDLLEVVRSALSAAPPDRVAIQARHKGASARTLAELVSSLLPLCRAARALLIVNDRADVARALGADGVHLPEAGLTVAEARAVLGEHALVGRSCHDRAGLERAREQGADYALLAPIGSVPGKGAPLGVEGFAHRVAGLALPVHALGGVEPELVPALRAAGAAGVAVSRGVLASGEPASALGAFVAALSR
jgi:thiamine-phosphate pyrophosphorylase